MCKRLYPLPQKMQKATRDDKTSKVQLEDSKVNFASTPVLPGWLCEQIPSWSMQGSATCVLWIDQRHIPCTSSPFSPILSWHMDRSPQRGVSAGHTSKLTSNSTPRVLDIAQWSNWLSWRTRRLMKPPTTSLSPPAWKRLVWLFTSGQENEKDVTSHGAKTLVLNHLLQTQFAGAAHGFSIQEH